jgi:hypothetical protein
MVGCSPSIATLPPVSAIPQVSPFLTVFAAAQRLQASRAAAARFSLSLIAAPSPLWGT